MLNQKIIKICEQKLIYLNYSKNTIKVYLNYIENFISNFPEKQIIHLNSSDFQTYLDNFNFSSVSQQNQIINSIKFLYEQGLNKKYDKVKFIRPRKELRLPNVISEEHIKNSIDKIQNIKHKAVLSLAYSIALRRSDVLNLKIYDIDSQSMQVKIIQGKGNKDAYLPLSQTCLDVLRKYYKQYKPKNYLFEGQDREQYSGESLNKIAKKYFGSQYHFHNIRHSTAIHLLNKGVDISFIQKLLRHSDIKTTMIYLKITTRDLNNLPIY